MTAFSKDPASYVILIVVVWIIPGFCEYMCYICLWNIWYHGDVIKWKHFPRYWPFVRGMHKGQWRGALMFSLICAWINRWVNNNEAGDLRRYHAHYDVIVMEIFMPVYQICAVSFIMTQYHHKSNDRNNDPVSHKLLPSALMIDWVTIGSGNAASLSTRLLITNFNAIFLSKYQLFSQQKQFQKYCG